MPSTTDAPITKSQFKLGLDCIQKLKHARDRLPQVSQDDELLRLLSEGGAAVEALIHAIEPGPIIGQFGPEALTQSREHIVKAFSDVARGKTTSLYEVTIEHMGFLARIDLLRIGPDGIELVEIKAKSVEVNDAGAVSDDVFLTEMASRVRSEWRPYVQDLAFQVELLKQWLAAQSSSIGAPPNAAVSAKFKLVNKSGKATASTVLSRENFASQYERGARGVRASVTYVGTAPDCTLLIEVPMDRIVSVVLQDAGSSVVAFAGRGIASCMTAMADIVNRNTWPPTTESLACSCKSCEFRVKSGVTSGFDRCWGPPSGRPEHHILELAIVKEKQLTPAMEAAGPNASVLDVPEANLALTQLMQFNSIKARAPLVVSEFARDPLAAITSGRAGPIYFLDFETFAYPIPSRVDGSPYEMIPFQFEAHSMPSANDSVRTRTRLSGFLELIDADPRRAFIDALSSQLGDSGVIFHWHTYERTVLNHIKKSLQTNPQASDDARITFIDTLVGPEGKGGGRLIDLLAIAKKSFYHPLLHGSYSIKKVVPIAWATPAIRDEFTAGHGATGDPDVYSGDLDPYDGLPAPPAPILEAVGGIERVKEVVAADDGSDDAGGAVRNGGMAMLAYHYVRMFAANPTESILQQFRQYCRLDSAAMVMAFALMRDHVKEWRHA